MTVCTPWRVAKTLDKLLDQINQAAPNRSKASDGSIGDSAHQAQGACNSQHNSCCIQYQGVWIVRARDFTHDPAGGCDIGKIFEQIRLSRDWRVRYIIFNSRITGPTHNWEWDPYTGDNPHDHHGHVSTFDDAARFDDISPWQIGAEDMNNDQDMVLRQSHAILRMLLWMWPPTREQFKAAGGDLKVWDYGGGLASGSDIANKMTLALQNGFTKVGEQLTVITQKLDGIAAGGGLTDADRELLDQTMAVVKELNGRLVAAGGTEGSA